MTYLLDTHILLWSRLDPTRLSASHRDILRDPDTLKCVSTISLWEISLKFSLGKLDLGGHTPEELMLSLQDFGSHIVTPDPACYASFHRLQPDSRHKDPFDRMLIWQAISSNTALLTHDNSFSSYVSQGLRLS